MIKRVKYSLSFFYARLLIDKKSGILILLRYKGARYGTIICSY